LGRKDEGAENAQSGRSALVHATFGPAANDPDGYSRRRVQTQPNMCREKSVGNVHAPNEIKVA
jgi:hypothetical protein